MKGKGLLALAAAGTLVFTGCGSHQGDVISGAAADTAYNADFFTARDFDVDYTDEKYALIQLNGDSASCETDAVSISGNTITIIDEGTYILEGTLDDGMVVVDAEKSDKTRIVLRNVSIHSESSAAIYVRQADKVFITLDENTENTLSSGESYTAIDDSNIDAVVFSKEDLTMNGKGSVSISSPAGHGIVSKDELSFTGGSYTITAASHGVEGKDNVCIAGANLTITSGKDAIHAENEDDAEQGFIYIEGGTFALKAEGDGISAAAFMRIDGGDFTITSGGGAENVEKKSSGMQDMFGGGGRGGRGGFGGWNSNTTEEDDSVSTKGLKAGCMLTVNGGNITLDTVDDAVHSNASVDICGGSWQIASGDDGFHADDTLTISGGAVTISESYEGLEGLHVFVKGGDITLTATDDGLNAAGGVDESGFGGMHGRDKFGSSSSDGSIVISGGKLHVTAYGDGIDANGTMEISGGYVTVCGPTSGDTATLDYDISAKISGGTFIGTGSSMMAQTFSDSEQGVVAANVGNRTAGTAITLTDASGQEVFNYTPPLAYAVVILSSPELVPGASYTMNVGSASGEIAAY